MSEEGFGIFLESNFGLKMFPDYDIYLDKNSNDFGNDVEMVSFDKEVLMSPFKIDIKSARPYSQWLLVEKHKFWASAYVMVSLSGFNDDWERNPYGSLSNKIQVEITGFCYYFDLIDGDLKKPWFTYTQGDGLYKADDVMRIIKELGSFTSDSLNNALSEKKVKRLGVSLKSPVNFGIPKKMLRNSPESWAILFATIISSSVSSPILALSSI